MLFKTGLRLQDNYFSVFLQAFLYSLPSQSLTPSLSSLKLAFWKRAEAQVCAYLFFHNSNRSLAQGDIFLTEVLRTAMPM